MKVNLCQYKKFSCYGCCGHTWTTKGDITRQVKENTRVYKLISREQFCDRGEKTLAPCGGCKSLVEKEGRILCGLHPMQNDGKEYRDRVCEKDFLCETFKAFKTWSKQKQLRFLNFIEKKDPTHYAYSMGVDSGRFMAEFERIEQKNRR